MRGRRAGAGCRTKMLECGTAGLMPWSGLRNVVRCADSGTVAGVWFQTVQYSECVQGLAVVFAVLYG